LNTIDRPARNIPSLYAGWYWPLATNDLNLVICAFAYFTRCPFGPLWKISLRLSFFSMSASSSRRSISPFSISIPFVLGISFHGAQWKRPFSAVSDDPVPLTLRCRVVRGPSGNSSRITFESCRPKKSL